MRINFDELDAQHSNSSSRTFKSQTIDLQIESPFYDKIVKSISPDNYRQEINSIKGLISMPESVDKFLRSQIQKQLQETPKTKMHQSSTFILKKVQSHQRSIQKERNPPPKKKKTEIKPKTNKYHYYHKHKCNTFLSRQAQKQIDEMKEVTDRPKLIAKKLTQKANQKRKTAINANGKHYSVHEHLYLEENRRKIRREARKQLEEGKKNALNKKKNKFKNYISIYERLDDILQGRNQKYNRKIEKDLTTGVQLFKPDLSRSQRSYEMIIQSISREKQSILETTVERVNPEISITPKKYHQDKNRDCLDQKVIDYFLEIFHPETENISEILTLKKLNKEDFKILQPFIHRIEQIENKVNDQETTVSSQKANLAKKKQPKSIEKNVFRMEFQKFYDKLNLYDRQVLRKKVRDSKKVYNKPINDGLKLDYKPEINVRSASLDNIAKGHSKHIYFV